MDSMIPKFQTNTLQYSPDPKEYKLYKAALEWDLIEPIVIENRKDLRSESKWKELVEPYHHQVKNLITFCRRLPVTLIADDVGLGKTISAGLVVSELMSRGRVSKILIVCPKLLIPQWREELDTKFGIPAIEATGSKLLTARPPEEGGAVITTYQSARLHFDSLDDAGFEMLILDEAHKLRNLYGVDPPPQVATRFRQALADRMFKYVLMLTATPIHNRLWDLYSLIDLLTVARGHQNPFGSEGMFVRNYIADNRTQARQLKSNKRDEFRSIVYGYMSRIRHGDAELYFPERVVQLHKVDPTHEETQLISIIAKPIQKLNRLAQISILQALISSPHALASQLNGMARKGTIPTSLAEAVQTIVDKIKTTSKLRGLGVLVDNLKTEQPENWRMVVFTGRRETQTTIQAFLEERGIKCGLINGDSGPRNQETIAKFKKNPPDIHAIISTEAGSEGVNLQAANVLINYDLPWNPMIVEQRIGRIQRLASEHANVCIFNIILKGTFEEYIVGRLMEKLQMAAHAIGDVEALLEAAGLDDNDDNNSVSFEEKIRQLVLDSLAGKDVEVATRSAEKSISDAKIELEREEKNINELLGGMNDTEIGPRCPKLPNPRRSMEPRDFVLKSLERLGARISHQSDNIYISELDGKRELIRFGNDQSEVVTTSILYSPGTVAFDRLVNKISARQLHRVQDIDQDTSQETENIAQKWVNGFQGNLHNSTVEDVWRCFDGKALMRVRATVAHDSYERLVEVLCSPSDHCIKTGLAGMVPITEYIENPEYIGALSNLMIKKAVLDPGISEFCRFYSERMVYETKAAGDDARKRKKLEDDFTPRIVIDLVGLEGNIHRELRVRLSYSIDSENEYTSDLSIIPSKGVIKNAPEIAKCSLTGRLVPQDCLGKCEITGQIVLRHLLAKSELSGKMALPEFIVECTLSGKHVLTSEVEKSSVTGHYVTSNLLKTSAISGKRAEPQFFARCDFSTAEVLESELGVSMVSGKRYRIDEQIQSAISGKTGHKQEFIFCSQTNQPLIAIEADKCEVTGKYVMPGILELCEVSGKKVLPSELVVSAASGKKALKKYIVSSSLSEARIIEQEAIRSVAGKYCAPLEAKLCFWSGRMSHPDDLKICHFTGVLIHSEYTTIDEPYRLDPLNKLLQGVQRNAEMSDIWTTISNSASVALNKGNCKVEAATLSPDSNHLAVSLEVKTWMGLKIQQAGLLYSVKDNTVVGRFVLGKRGPKGWIQA